MILPELFLALALAAGAVEAPRDFPSLNATLPQLPRFQRQKGSERPAPPRRNLFEDPRPRPLLPAELPGPVLARMSLAAHLDRNQDLLTRQLGDSLWTIGMAGDASFKSYFLTFRQGQRLLIAPLGSLSRLRGNGVDVAIEPGLVYNFKVSVSIFSPVRGSTLEIRPARGSRGPRHEMKTGALLDIVKARSLVFMHGQTEYWALYGTDVDAATGQLAASHSALFVHMNGLDSKAWPVAESALPVDQAVRVTLAKALALTRTAAELVIQQPR